ncbi:class I SAM-dependent methyltransferase [bacterium]|nr:class I SAM-dependent methyltransferase [bacterium]
MKEEWLLPSNDLVREVSCNVQVRIGKDLNLRRLKGSHDQHSAKAEEIRRSRSTLYESNEIEPVTFCPVCGASSETSTPRATIMGATYHQCRQCSHVFVKDRPTRGALERFYRENKEYAICYADPNSIAVRIEEIAIPKLKWITEVFRERFGREPRSVLDVGAGAGHFVFAAEQRGLRAVGVELSESARAFAREHFRMELQPVDFLNSSASLGTFDIVSFWGLIEHTTQPVEFLRAARSCLAGQTGLVIAEVPRWTSLGTAVQLEFLNTITRHLDPLGHINVFTDSSLATAFVVGGLSPVAAWYYGMDAYELITQLAMRSAGVNDGEFADVANHLLRLQPWIDRARMTDEIILAGCPLREE